MSTQIVADSEKSNRIDEFLRAIGVGRRPINDPFFNESHEACKVFRRTGVTVEDDEDLCHDVMKEFPCCVFGCKTTFHNLIDFEIHYNGSHRYVCQECKKIRPNPRLLEIHIQETHDSYFRVLAEKQPVYQCYVSECDAKFANPEERREHCFAFHKFPTNYRFDRDERKTEKNARKTQCAEAMEVERDGSSSSKSKKNKIILNKNQKIKTFGPGAVLRSSGFSNSNDEVRMECSANESSAETQTRDETPILRAEKSCSVRNTSLAFVPRQVVQKSYTKALTNNKMMERNVLETETLMDLAQSLPD